MKKYMDKLSRKIRFNKNLFVFLIVLVLVGVGSGALFSVILSNDDKAMVSNYLNDFMLNVSNNSLKLDVSFFNSLVFTLGFALLIWIFGISMIGVIMVLPFLFIKSFILGFSIGSILVNFKFKGILISLVYIVPHHVINILVYILLSAYSIMVSYRLIKCMRGRKVLDFKVFMGKYTFVLLFSMGLLFITSLYEAFILPSVLKLLINLLK